MNSLMEDVRRGKKRGERARFIRDLRKWMPGGSLRCQDLVLPGHNTRAAWWRCVVTTSLLIRVERCHWRYPFGFDDIDGCWVKSTGVR